MRRRDFITLFGAAVAVWSPKAGAQQTAVPRIGYVFVGTRGTDSS